MSVVAGEQITQADMDALADLANSIGAPAIDFTHEFTYFDVALEPPTELTGVINYGVGGYTADGKDMIVHLYAYKTVSGRKHYSQKFAIGSVRPNSSTNPFEVEWSWTASPSTPDGYLFVLWQGGDTGFGGWWSEIGASPFTDDFSTLTDPDSLSSADWNPVEGWEFVANGERAVVPNNLAYQVGPWLRQLDRLRRDAFGELAANDAQWLVSGPWCVAVGPRLRFGSDATVYGDVEFWYAVDDLAGNVDVDTLVEIGNEGDPVELSNDISPSLDVFQETLDFNLSSAKTATGRIVFNMGAAIAGGHTESLTVTAGAVTIVTETWTVDGAQMTLDFEFSLPAGASTVRVDVDLNDAGNSVDPTPGFWADIVVSTENVAPTDAVALHPTSAAKKVAPTNISYTFTCTFKSTSYYPVFRIEDDSVEGVWVAMTRPAFGMMAFVQQDLPNYYSSTGASSAAKAVSYEDSYPIDATVEPAVLARPALWPVFRDTEFGTWKNTPQQPSGILLPYWPGVDPFNYFLRTQVSLSAGDNSVVNSVVVGADYEELILRTSDPAMEIYVSTVSQDIDPDNAATYDATDTGELRLPGAFAWIGGGTVWVAVKNPTASAATFYLERILTVKDDNGSYPGKTPVFFRTEADRSLGFEPYSFNVAPSTRNGTYGHTLQTPDSGYCIYRVKVSRKAAIGDNGLFAIPSTGTSELVVSVGVVRGCDYDTAGTYSELGSFTIPAGDGSVDDTTVFWPVLSGCTLAYQCSKEVDVMAFVNFQPAVTCEFHPPRYAQSGAIAGRYSGKRIVGSPFSGGVATGFFSNYYGSNIFDRVMLPMSAFIYNDTESILNLL